MIFSSLRRLTFRFCQSFTQKNHKMDFTANRINQKFLHLHLDYLEMDPKNYDERLAVNIFLKSVFNEDYKMAHRILEYIRLHLNKIDNLASINNIVRYKVQQAFMEYDFLPFYKIGLNILVDNNEENIHDTNKTFKNYEPNSITHFFKHLFMSPYINLLKQTENNRSFKQSIELLGVWHLSELIKILYQKQNMKEEINCLIDRLGQLQQIFSPSDVKELRQMNTHMKNKKILTMIRNYKGTKHAEEYQNY